MHHIDGARVLLTDLPCSWPSRASSIAQRVVLASPGADNDQARGGHLRAAPMFFP